MNPYSPSDALSVIQACYGPAAQVAAQPGSNHPVYRLRVDGGELVVKLSATADGSSLAKEHRLIGLLAERQVPVPLVDRFDPTGQRWGWPLLAMPSAGRATVYDWIRREGRTKYWLFREMGEIQARLHGIAMSQSGEILPEGFEPHRPEQYWSSLGQWARELSAAGVLELAEAEAFARLAPPRVDGVQLCHSDYHAVQCVEQGGRITAVVDWESAWAGNPLVDLAITHAYLDFYAPPVLVDEFFDGYRSVSGLPADYASGYLPVRAAQTLGVLRAWHGRGLAAWQAALAGQRVARVVELFRRYLRQIASA